MVSLSGLVLFMILLFSCQPIPKGVELDKYKNQIIEGQVLLKEELKGKVPKEGYFLILSVRMLDSPMPIAVLRVKNPEFPYKFKITGKHKLSHERIMEGDVILSARISKSPQANANKGDLVGVSNAKVGDKKVVIVIDREVATFENSNANGYNFD